jgi:DNA-binding transcriptional LysR family regulator
LLYALKIIELYAEAKNRLNTTDEPSGELVIGASESLMVCRMPSILIDFKRAYPKVNVSLKSLNQQNLSPSLKNGDVDLAIIVGNDQCFDTDLVLEKVKKEEMVLISSLSDEENKKTVLYTEERCSYKGVLDQYIREKEIDVSRRLSNA